MTPTNRPITSREYKLLLNTERFRDRTALKSDADFNNLRKIDCYQRVLQGN